MIETNITYTVVQLLYIVQRDELFCNTLEVTWSIYICLCLYIRVGYAHSVTYGLELMGAVGDTGE